MEKGFSMRLEVAMLMVALVPWAVSQAAGGSNVNRSDPISTPGRLQTQAETNRDVIREIDDPHSGARWLLSSDSSHPGGPGRLVLAGKLTNRALQSEPGGANTPPATPLAIRAGDRVILEEHSAVVDAELQAVALGQAAIGSSVQVRLAVGGKVVRALAVAAGRVSLQPETEGRP